MTRSTQTADDAAVGITGGSRPNLWQRLTACALALVAASRLLFVSFHPLFLGAPWMLYLRDDSFYYLKVAQNLAHGAGSTFNGLVPTNGYHPLWLLLLTGLELVTARPAYILAFMAVAGFFSGLATYFLSYRILRVSGLAILPSSAFALLVLSYDTPMIFGGMEVTLTVPLMLLVILMALHPSQWMVVRAQALLFSLAISAMVLSRLDSLIFAALLLFFVFIQKSLRRNLQPGALSGLLLGLVPIAVYFVSNLSLFHTLLPVSGMAKQLKHGWMPSAPALRSAFDTSPFDQAISLFILLSLASLAILHKRLAPLQRAVYLAVLIFPFLYIGILSCRSDWSLWTWYLYVFRPALCIAFALLVAWRPVTDIFNRHSVVGAALLAVFALASVPNIHWQYGSRDTGAIYEAALDLQSFSASHPGIYAMGDRSGMPAYLLSNPVVQTEGLMMDRAYLDHIRQQEPLLTVLADYNVRYFVTGSRSAPTGCLHVSEPAQAGPASPHMQAELCNHPVASFAYPKDESAKFIYVSVFDLKPPADKLSSGMTPAPAESSPPRSTAVEGR